MIECKSPFTRVRKFELFLLVLFFARRKHQIDCKSKVDFFSLILTLLIFDISSILIVVHIDPYNNIFNLFCIFRFSFRAFSIFRDFRSKFRTCTALQKRNRETFSKGPYISRASERERKNRCILRPSYALSLRCAGRAAFFFLSRFFAPARARSRIPHREKYRCCKAKLAKNMQR